MPASGKYETKPGQMDVLFLGEEHWIAEYEISQETLKSVEIFSLRKLGSL